MGMENYVMLHELGKGAYGTATAVRHKVDGQLYVLKRVRLARQTAKERHASLEEIHILSNLAHRNIMAFKESWVDAGCIVCLVVELCEGGDLLLQLRLRAPGGLHFSETHLQEMLVQLMSALAYLHRNSIAHRDFKSANILITSVGCLKLCDFGLACVLDESEGLKHTMVGTPSYMCPELFQAQPYGCSADIWALGCVMYELSALRPAYQAFNMSGLKQKVVSKPPPPLPTYLSEEWRACVKSLLHKDAQQRPSADEVLELPWLQDAVQRVREQYGPDVPEGAEELVSMQELPEEIAKLEQQFQQLGVEAQAKGARQKALRDAAALKFMPKALRLQSAPPGAKEASHLPAPSPVPGGSPLGPAGAAAAPAATKHRRAKSRSRSPGPVPLPQRCASENSNHSVLPPGAAPDGPPCPDAVASVASLPPATPALHATRDSSIPLPQTAAAAAAAAGQLSGEAGGAGGTVGGGGGAGGGGGGGGGASGGQEARIQAEAGVHEPLGGRMSAPPALLHALAGDSPPLSSTSSPPRRSGSVNVRDTQNLAPYAGASAATAKGRPKPAASGAVSPMPQQHMAAAGADRNLTAHRTSASGLPSTTGVQQLPAIVAATSSGRSSLTGMPQQGLPVGNATLGRGGRVSVLAGRTSLAGTGGPGFAALPGHSQPQAPAQPRSGRSKVPHSGGGGAHQQQVTRGRPLQNPALAAVMEGAALAMMAASPYAACR